MRAAVSSLCLLSVLVAAGPARADAVGATGPRWSTPGPREVGEVAGLSPRVTGLAARLEGRPPEPRDPRVALVRERVDVRVLRNVILTEIHLTLRGVEDAPDFVLALPEQVRGSRGAPFHFVEAERDGGPVEVVRRVAGPERWWALAAPMARGQTSELRVRYLVSAPRRPAVAAGRQRGSGVPGRGWALGVR